MAACRLVLMHEHRRVASLATLRKALVREGSDMTPADHQRRLSTNHHTA
jgi:hypothetical protein